MPPRRETFTAKDGRSYTLWADIDDVMSAVMPAYWSTDARVRKERGWMFRGQINSEWDLIPSLYRPPCDEAILKARQDYTKSFVDTLKKEAERFGLKKLSDTEYLAIAQHYGFYTPLLDFTWNAEVAAYFATEGAQRGQVGVIYGFHLKEYNEMRNPFAALGLSIEDSDTTFKQAGMESLPDLEITELYNVPRIYAQEGIFIRVTPEKMPVLFHECIDRFYFRQRPNGVYKGNFAHRSHALPSRGKFDTDASYDAFIELVRKQRPELFERTETFEVSKLFPPADPLSQFAEAWKQANPDPLKSSRPQQVQITASSSSQAYTPSFSDQVETYYYSDLSRSPYNSQYLARGRELVESLGNYAELSNLETQRWLLWELLKRNLSRGLICTLKLGNAGSWGSDQEGFRFIVVDRWLADSYQHTLSWDQLGSSFCEITFGVFSKHGRPEVSVREVEAFDPPKSVDKVLPVNPHAKASAPGILSAVEKRLVGLQEGVIGSFLYDLHHIVMLSMGRNLALTAALVEAAPCLQRSPLVRPAHVNGPALLVRLADHFTGGVTHTAVCENHWDHMSEADVDVMHPVPWTLLGLA